MNILTHTVTPIVICVVLAAIITAVWIKIASDRRKARALEEDRRMRVKVARHLIDEVRSKPKPLPASRHAGLRRSAVTNRYQPSRRSEDASYDPSAALITTGILYSDPSPSYCAPSSSSSDSGSSSSSSSSSDSGGSCGGGGGE